MCESLDLEMNFQLTVILINQFLKRRDLETFLLGLETFLKLLNIQIVPGISLQFLILVIKTTSRN
jgi:hypothetical protein